MASFVDFEINVVVESAKKDEGGINLSVFKIGASAKLSDAEKQANSHKVKFRVPILLPAHEEEK